LFILSESQGNGSKTCGGDGKNLFKMFWIKPQKMRPKKNNKQKINCLDKLFYFLFTVSQMIYFHITLVYALKLTRNGFTAPTLRSGEAPCGCLVKAKSSTEFKV